LGVLTTGVSLAVGLQPSLLSVSGIHPVPQDESVPFVLPVGLE